MAARWSAWNTLSNFRVMKFDAERKSWYEEEMERLEAEAALK